MLHGFECQPRINSQHEGSSDAPVTNPKRAPGPKFNSPGGLNPFDNSRGKQSSMPPHTSRSDSLFEMAYTAQDPRLNRRGTLKFPPQLEMRPPSIAPKVLESREAPPNSAVFLTSHRHPEKLAEITVTSQWNRGLLPQLKKDLEILPSTSLEAQFHCRDSRAMPRSPSQLKWTLDFPGATREAP